MENVVLQNIAIAVIGGIVANFFWFGLSYLIPIRKPDYSFIKRFKGFIIGLIMAPIAGLLFGAIIGGATNIMQSISGGIFGYALTGTIFWFCITPGLISLLLVILTHKMLPEIGNITLLFVGVVEWSFAIGGAMLFSGFIEKPPIEAEMQTWLIYWFKCWSGGGLTAALSSLPILFFFAPPADKK